jgi:uncharacterized membrane protein
MARTTEKARAEFRRMMAWIAVAGVLMVIGALVFLAWTDALSFHAVIATVLGVFDLPAGRGSVRRQVAQAAQKSNCTRRPKASAS